MTAARLTIRGVRTRAVVVPLRRPVATRVGTFSRWPLVLVDLETEEGVVGRGYLAPYLEKVMAYVIPAIRDLVEARRGEPVAPIEIHGAARKALGLIGHQGLATMAVAGLDIACWDALAKAAGLPLARLLGGTLAPVRAYNSNGLGLMPPDQVKREARELVEEGGFDAIKVRVGRERLADDLAAIRNVRAEVGPDVKLMCDFNQGLSFGEALLRCRALDGEGVYWIEEPIAYEDLEGCARLAQATATPIQIGENFYGPKAMHAALRLGTSDYVMPDLMRIGGVSGWLRAAALAEAHGIEMSSHLYPEISSHLLRVTPTAHWLEWQDWAHPVLAAPFPVQNGHVTIRDVPGNGLEWDEEAVARYRYEG